MAREFFKNRKKYRGASVVSAIITIIIAHSDEAMETTYIQHVTSAFRQ